MNRRTVLVVEDNDALRELYRTALTFAGFEVKEAGTGLDALRMIDAFMPAAIVLDLDLPHVSGFGVLYDLRQHAHTRRIPVVVVTGMPDKVEHENVDCVLRKPIGIAAVVKAVTRCIEAARS